MPKKLFSLLLIVVVALALVVGGCQKQQAAKKPVPKPKVTAPNTVTAPAKKPVSPMSTSEARKLADKLTNLAVTVKGVNSATVVVQPANNQVTALVGLMLSPEVKGKETVKVKKEVADKLKKADKRVTGVLVTTNPDLVRRIQDIARGIIAGKPVQSFASEISELTRRIAPSMK